MPWKTRSILILPFSDWKIFLTKKNWNISRCIFGKVKQKDLQISGRLFKWCSSWNVHLMCWILARFAWWSMLADPILEWKTSCWVLCWNTWSSSDLRPSRWASRDCRRKLWNSDCPFDSPSIPSRLQVNIRHSKRLSARISSKVGGASLPCSNFAAPRTLFIWSLTPPLQASVQPPPHPLRCFALRFLFMAPTSISTGG